jgi:hypothetical protein
MSESDELLALRKEVLVARSALCRLRIGRDVAAVRDSLSLPKAGAAIAGSHGGRAMALGLLVSGLGSGRVARIIALAGRALVIARVALAVAGMVRRAPDTPPDRAA